MKESCNWCYFVFFFKQKTAYEMRISDWSSDVCSSDLEESSKANVAIVAMLPLMVLLMLAVIMAQVRSFPTMFLVIATAPLGVIGAVPALLLTGRPFGFTAMLGLIGLAGILMRNTLILVDQIRQNNFAGFDDRNAVIEATVHRARPVLLTALAAVLTFAPLALSTFWG